MKSSVTAAILTAAALLAATTSTTPAAAAATPTTSTAAATPTSRQHYLLITVQGAPVLYDGGSFTPVTGRSFDTTHIADGVAWSDAGSYAIAYQQASGCDRLQVGQAFTATFKGATFTTASGEAIAESHDGREIGFTTGENSDPDGIPGDTVCHADGGFTLAQTRSNGASHHVQGTATRSADDQLSVNADDRTVAAGISWTNHPHAIAVLNVRTTGTLAKARLLTAGSCGVYRPTYQPHGTVFAIRRCAGGVFSLVSFDRYGTLKVLAPLPGVGRIQDVRSVSADSSGRVLILLPTQTLIRAFGHTTAVPLSETGFGCPPGTCYPTRLAW